MRLYRRICAGLAVLLVAATAACSSDEDDAREVLDEFLAGWSSGDLAGVPFINPLNEQVASGDVATQLTALSGDLAEEPPQLTVDDLQVNEGLGTAQVQVDWSLPGGATWTYPTTVRLQDDDGWRVIWSPEVVHPDLVEGDELLLRREPAPRGNILDGAGDPLVTARDVVDVGIWPAQVQDLEAEVAALEDALRTLDPTIDLSDLPADVEAAEPDQYVHVVTLRAGDYEQVRDRIHPLPGTQFNDYQLHLAPTSTFARALLGTVGEVTAEIIENNPGVYEAGDQAGRGGLSQQYDERLRGVPGQTVLIARDETELVRIDPEPGTDLQVTLDPEVQLAAEQALSEESKPAALVAIRVSDGAVLAVANTEGAKAHDVNIALTGSVPPGSTFKAVSGYGLLDAGEVTLDEQVACPAEYTVGGFTITNSFSGDRGEIPFRDAVAISCNTAFAGLAPRLGDNGLATAGAALGLGGDWELGTEAFTGSVPSGGSELDRAVAAFGQGDTQVSPVAMAVATAALARGAWLPPTLVVDPEAAAAEPTPLNASAVGDVQTAMRRVVTDGTASELASTPGGDVSGKTGTAEAGPEVTHGWFVGWQGDLAFAVFVQDGRSSSAAVPLVDDFLRTLAE